LVEEGIRRETAVDVAEILQASVRTVMGHGMGVEGYRRGFRVMS
jgi:hypothetical protein